ncbi:hypothetical protein, conserved [Eimeria praecox]|uniref:Uncharacterized protein n=1 Tax=Eimeria praecox TaxID=51316 RepID=U6GUI2_9EIME|nr:hypothetical protein, conserved [Eimeria praecox]
MHDDSDSTSSDDDSTSALGSTSSSLSLKRQYSSAESSDSNVSRPRLPIKRRRVKAAPPYYRIIDEEEHRVASELLVQQMREEEPGPSTSSTSEATTTPPTVPHFPGSEIRKAVGKLQKVQFPEDTILQDAVVWWTETVQNPEELKGKQTTSKAVVVKTVDSSYLSVGSSVPETVVEEPEDIEETELAEGDESSPYDEAEPAPDSPGEGGSRKRKYRAFVPEVLSELGIDDHPFCHLPQVNKEDIKNRVHRDFYTLSSEGCRLVAPLLAEVRVMLLKKSLNKWDANYLVTLAERLIAHLFYFEDLQIQKVCKRAIFQLGRRVLVLEALVSILGLLGEDTQGDWWQALVNAVPLRVGKVYKPQGKSELELYHAEVIESLLDMARYLKAGRRPPNGDIVHVKQLLFCSPHSPSYFRSPDFSSWREDNEKFWLSKKPEEKESKEKE